MFPVRVLVVGGTGVFGSRLVTGILENTGFDIVLAARDAGRLARAIAGRMTSADGRFGARLTATTMDTASVTPESLRATGAFAVVDAAGPYQCADYRFARAAIAAGLHYVDLADARDFVAGFGVLDAAAKAAGVVALTGASSTPALSSAVLDRMTASWTRVDRVEIAISPGNRAPRGLSVIRSILSYAGRPVRVFDDGGWRTRPGWGMTVRREVPGIGRRWLSLSETPDLDIVPARFRTTEAAIFRAGLELAILHLGLWLVSLPVRLGVTPSLVRLARPTRAAAGMFENFGTDRGGMTVEATGVDCDGAPVMGAWVLVAEAGDGPFVPSLPALVALEALADGRLKEAGASACVGVLPLDDIEARFGARRIRSRMTFAPTPVSLYRKVLGDRFEMLPEAIRAMHEPGFGLRASGTAVVDGPIGLLASIVSAIFGFPPAAGQVPVTVTINPERRGERWIRSFGDRRFSSFLSRSRRTGGVVERFGLLSFDLDLDVNAEGVRGMPVRGFRLGPLPLPRFLAPLSKASERVDRKGRFSFDVEVSLPFGLGRVVRYRGTLEPHPGSDIDGDNVER